jgi:hypothetical protein
LRLQVTLGRREYREPLLAKAVFAENIMHFNQKTYGNYPCFLAIFIRNGGSIWLRQGLQVESYERLTP